jgi:HK97 gp10 family phage protein
MAAVTSKTVTVEGLSETVDALEELTSATQANVMRRVLLQAGQPIADAARALAPRGPSGNLIASISVVPAQPSKMTRSSRGEYDKQSTVEVVVEAGPVPQSIFQEFGTRNNAAQPFMRPAWHGQRDQALQIITEQMSIEIEKARARAALKAARIAAKIAAG